MEFHLLKETNHECFCLSLRGLDYRCGLPHSTLVYCQFDSRSSIYVHLVHLSSYRMRKYPMRSGPTRPGDLEQEAWGWFQFCIRTLQFSGLEVCFLCLKNECGRTYLPTVDGVLMRKTWASSTCIATACKGAQVWWGRL